MRLPLPTSKSQTDLVASLPEVNATCHALMLFWGTTNETKDTVSKAQDRGGGVGVEVVVSGSRRVGGVRKES